MVPYAVTAIKNLSMQRDDGIITLYCMNTKDNLKLYGDKKYWNLDVRDEFMHNTRSLWYGNFDSKHQGSIFNTGRGIDIESVQSQVKVAGEL